MQSMGMTDEVLGLRAALNEKDLELLELREQHVQLVTRSQEARSNWESALSSKDRAIQQLEDALMSRQRAIDQLLAVASNAAEQELLLEKNTKIGALEQALHEAHSTIAGLHHRASDLMQEHDALQAKLQSRSQEDRRLELLRQQLSAAFQEELAASQDSCARFEATVARLSTENQQLRGAVEEREQQVGFLTGRHQELKQQVEALRVRVLQEQRAAAAEAQPPPAPAAAPLPPPAGDSLLELQQKLLHCSGKLQTREAQARKYKDAVRALQARLLDADRLLTDQAQRSGLLELEVSRLQQLVKQGPVQAVGGPGPEAGLLLRTPGFESGEAKMAALVQELRQQLQDKEAALGKVLSEAEYATRERQDLGSRLEDAHRRAEEAGRKVRNLEAQASDVSRQVDQAKQRHHEDQQLAEDLRRQISSFESRIEDLERKLQEARRQGERCEQRAERAERSLLDREMQLMEAERHTKQGEVHTLGLERRAREQEARVTELEKQARDAELRCTEAESRSKLAEVRAMDAEKRALDAESWAMASERRCRELDAQASEAAARYREVDKRRQEQEIGVQSAEAAAKQVRLDCDREVLQLQRSLDMVQQGSQRDLAELKSQLERMQRSKEAAEGRLNSLEEEARQQEQLLASLRNNSQSVPQLRMTYEERIRGMEESLLTRDKNIAQLRDSLKAADSDYRKSLQTLMLDLEAKTIALGEAEARFSELEALMQRIVARSSFTGLP